MNEFNLFYQSVLTDFETHLNGAIHRQEPIKLYQPIQEFMSIPGKRIRPMLCLLTFYSFKNEYRSILPLAYAIELFHNFTLIHDDIMDNAATRRGVPTVHTKYNINQGILSGDMTLLLAYDQLFNLHFPPEKKNSILQYFTDLARYVCDGQQYDLDFEKENIVSISSYLEMIRLKTSVLLGGSIQIGAMAADASESDILKLYNFGEELGLSFQIMDDYLDTFGDATLGKKIGGDILRKKKTFLSIQWLNEATSEEKEIFFDDHIDDDEKILKIQESFKAYNMDKKVLEMAHSYGNEALRSLDAVTSIDTNNLRALANQILQRSY